MLTSKDIELRAEKVEEIVDENFEILADPRVVDALGKYAEILWGLTQELYMPIYRDGVYFAPPDRQESGIPLIVVDNDEHFTVDTRSINSLHRQQIDTLYNFICHIYDEDVSIEFFDDIVEQIYKSNSRIYGESEHHGSMNPHWLAYTTNSEGYIDFRNSKHTGIFKKRWVITRPIIVARLEQDYYGSAVFIHELVHAIQRFRRIPYYPQEFYMNLDHKRREHEAHHIQALALTALYGDEMASNETWRWLVTYDKIRRIKNKSAPDEYWASV